jgi:S-adenosylmethionine decarboxylase
LNDKSSASVVNLGRHLLAEFYDCNSNILNNVQLVEDAMTEAAIACGATVVQKNFHHFSPFGVSGVVIIAESHLAIHTWPEYGYCAVDLFTCGESCDPKVAYDYLQDALGAGSAFYSELKRGLLNTETNRMMESPFHVEKQMATVTAGAEHIGSANASNAQLNEQISVEMSKHERHLDAAEKTAVENKESKAEIKGSL